jgi:3-methyladenine DNA glycosylase AlkD
MSTDVNAKRFLERLKAYRSSDELKKIQRYFKSGEGQYGEGDKFIGVRMGQVFALAKEFIEMPPREIEKLLESEIHEARAGAVSILVWKARNKKTTAARRKELFDLYLRRHDRINNWDLVDRSAPYVVGGYLLDKPRDILYKLARSKNVWERRTAIVSTYYFVRQGDVADTFKIAEMLLKDNHDLIHKATGGWLREAGKKDPQRLLGFLDKHAATMPRTALRYAIERLNKKQRTHYLGMKERLVELGMRNSLDRTRNNAR